MDARQSQRRAVWQAFIGAIADGRSLGTAVVVAVVQLDFWFAAEDKHWPLISHLRLPQPIPPYDGQKYARGQHTRPRAIEEECVSEARPPQVVLEVVVEVRLVFFAVLADARKIVIVDGVATQLFVREFRFVVVVAYDRPAACVLAA